MKLIRFGNSKSEKPGILTDDGIDLMFQIFYLITMKIFLKAMELKS